MDFIDLNEPPQSFQFHRRRSPAVDRDQTASGANAAPLSRASHSALYLQRFDGKEDYDAVGVTVATTAAPRCFLATRTGAQDSGPKESPASQMRRSPGTWL